MFARFSDVVTDPIIGMLTASMAADVVDIDTARSGEQRTGLYFSLCGSSPPISR